jgi:hypothetical protein
MVEGESEGVIEERSLSELVRRPVPLSPLLPPTMVLTRPSSGRQADLGVFLITRKDASLDPSLRFWYQESAFSPQRRLQLVFVYLSLLPRAMRLANWCGVRYEECREIL